MLPVFGGYCSRTFRRATLEMRTSSYVKRSKFTRKLRSGKMGWRSRCRSAMRRRREKQVLRLLRNHQDDDSESGRETGIDRRYSVAMSPSLNDSSTFAFDRCDVTLRASGPLLMYQLYRSRRDDPPAG